MMRLIGNCRLGKDAEIRSTRSGVTVANLVLAYNYGQKDRDGKKPSQWIQASLFGDRADSLAPFLGKGTLIFVDMKDIHIEVYEGKDGKTYHNMRGTIDSLEFVGKAEKTAGAKKGTRDDDWDDENEIPF
jgi:single-strand DNA-binding protein